MNHMFGKILCWMGFHKWWMAGHIEGHPIKRCARCPLGVILTILLISGAWAAVAQGQVLYPLLLRDTVCAEETRGHPRPAWAVGNPDPMDWGVCQIRYESAWRYGGFDAHMRRTGIPGRSPGDLFIPEVSRGTAANIIALCITWYPRGDAVRIGYCYTAGLNSEPRSNRRKWRWALMLGQRYDAKAREIRLVR